jgi:hypothetical protein
MGRTFICGCEKTYEKDFPRECPYAFQQIMEYEPWLEER